MASRAGWHPARPVLASGYRPSLEPHQFAFAPMRIPVPLRTRLGGRTVSLAMSEEYIIAAADGSENRGAVRIVGYHYQILAPQKDEILAYHWHPISVSPVTHPHLHLSSRISPVDIGNDFPLVALACTRQPARSRSPRASASSSRSSASRRGGTIGWRSCETSSDQSSVEVRGPSAVSRLTYFAARAGSTAGSGTQSRVR